MKSYTNIFLLLLTILFTSCSNNKDKNNTKQYTETTKSYSNYLTYYKNDNRIYGSKISPNCNLVFKLSVSKLESIKIKELKKYDIKDFFDFAPKIKGEFLISNDEVRIYPATTLNANQEYKGIFKFKKISNNILKDINIDFTTSSRTLNVKDNNIEISKKDFTYKLKVKIIPNVSSELLKEATSLTWNNKDYKLNISKIAENTYLIMSKKIKLLDTKGKIKLKIDGSKIGFTGGIDFNKENFLPKINSEFEALGIEQLYYRDKLALNLIFNRQLNPKKDYKPFITIKPSTDFETEVIDRKLLLKGEFNAGTKYTIQVSSGLESDTNEKISDKTEFKESIISADLKPMCQFLDNGTLLSSDKDYKVSFKAINLRRVKITLIKIHKDKTLDFLNNHGLRTRNSNSYYGRDNYNSYGFSKKGDIVYKEIIEIGEEKNIWQNIQLDLKKEFKNTSNGFYVLKLNFDEDDLLSYPKNKNYWNIRYFVQENGTKIKHILQTDLALNAIYDKDELIITTYNINKEKLQKDVEITVKTKKGVNLGSGKSNENGYFKLKMGNKNPEYVIASYNNQYSYLKLSENILDKSLFEIDGKTPSNLEAFIYSDRDVYRPGDKLHLSIILRNKNKKLPANYPIIGKLYNPRNQLVYSKQSNKGIDGHFSLDFSTKMEDLTGNWTAKIKAGGKTFTKTIKIETIVPYKLKVNITTNPKKIDLIKNKKIGIKINSKFLFGAPASQHKSITKIKLEPNRDLEKKYSNFIFHNQSSFFDNEYPEQYERTLDKNGNTLLKWKIPSTNELKRSNSAFNLYINSRVLESNGRPVMKDLTIPLHYYKNYIGIEKIKDNRLSEGSDHNFKILIVDQSGKKKSKGKVSYKLYRMKRYWWWHFDDEHSFRKHYKTDTETSLISQGKVDISAGLGNLKLNFNDYGAMLLEVTDEDGNHTAGYFFHCGWSRNSRSKNADITSIFTDKEIYFPNQTAKIKINTPNSGKLLWAIENSGKIIKKGVKEINSTKTELNIKISKNDIPNIYLLATIIQDKNNVINDLPKRLFAIKKIIVKPKNKKLDYVIKFDSIKLEPEKEFKVRLSTKQKKSSSVTLAIIDEGLLDITDYQTPDPYNFFYSPYSMLSRIYDNLGDFIGPNPSYIHKIVSIGGGIYGKKKKKIPSQESLQNIKRFETVALFKGPFKTDAKGNATLKFKMPNYLGSVRVIVVGCDDKSYGNADVNIPVKSDLMISTSLPRVAGPLDKFTIPVTVFDELAKETPLNITITTENGLKVISKKQITIDKPKNQNKINFELVAEKIAKTVKINILAKVGSKEYSKDYFLTVRPYQPYTYNTQEEVIKSNKTIKFPIPNEGIKGTSSVSFTASLLPKLNLQKRLKWLLRYPYGCIEQTVSTGFPQLSLASVIQMNAKQKNIISKNVNATIDKLKTFQLNSGGFSYWPGGNRVDYWGTNYALYFLLTAKENGYSIPAELLNNCLSYQKQESRVKKSGTYLTKTFRLFLLAKADKIMLSQMNYLKESKLDKLDNASLAYLSESYRIGGYNKVSKNILSKISKKNTKEYNWYTETYGSSLRDKAIIAKAYLNQNELKKSALYIKDISESISNNRWYSTQTIGYCLNTLAKYIKNYKQNTRLDFTLNSKKLIDFGVDSKQSIISIPLENHFGDTLSVTNNNNTPLFTNLVWEGIPVDLKDLKPQSNKIELSVNYYDDKGKELKIDSLPSGISFYAHIRLIKGNNYVKNEIAVTQVLPSGWEIENLRLKGASLPRVLNKLNTRHIDYIDIRDDRISWFLDLDRWQKNYDFVIKINSVTKGTYTLPPTVAEAMYDNKCKAVTKSKTVKVY